MNAKERKRLIDAIETYLPLEFRDPTLRALRLLAAAEANGGTTPETNAYYRTLNVPECEAHALRLERERNGLAARVAELEAKVRLLNIFKGCAMDAIEAHEITNQGDHDVIGALIGIDARSK